MRRYETLMVLDPELPEAQIRETLDRIRRLIEGMGAECERLEEWGMRDLAYPIRKQSRGYYVLVEYNGKPEVVRELERTLKIGDEFLRFVSVVSPVRRIARLPRARKGQTTASGTRDAVGLNGSVE